MNETTRQLIRHHIDQLKRQEIAMAHGRGIPEAARITECEECGAVIPATRRFCDQDCINTNRRREASP
jgi:hypothetical protein